MTQLPPGVTYAYRNVQGYPEGDPLAANHYRYRANDRAAKGVNPAQKANLNGPKWIDKELVAAPLPPNWRINFENGTTNNYLKAAWCWRSA